MTESPIGKQLGFSLGLLDFFSQAAGNLAAWFFIWLVGLFLFKPGC
jgi:hypothetical protein